jgi:hypothetical protein
MVVDVERLEVELEGLKEENRRKEAWGGAGIRDRGMSLGLDAPCSGVGYRFLRFAGREGFFRSLVFCFFSLCSCLCFSSPSFFAFLVLVISETP